MRRWFHRLLMRRWLKRQLDDVAVEREAVRQERAAQRDLLHEVADAVIQLRTMAERLEELVREEYESKEGEPDAERPSDG